MLSSGDFVRHLACSDTEVYKVCQHTMTSLVGVVTGATLLFSQLLFSSLFYYNKPLSLLKATICPALSLTSGVSHYEITVNKNAAKPTNRAEIVEILWLEGQTLLTDLFTTASAVQ